MSMKISSDTIRNRTRNLPVCSAVPQPLRHRVLIYYYYCYILITYIFVHLYFGGPASSVGIATLYGPDGPGIESRWGAKFSAPVHTGPGAHSASCTMGTGSFPGIKRPGRGVDHPPTSSAELKERVELYLYSPLGLRGLFWGELYLLAKIL
jgi:hypothetical protein